MKFLAQARRRALSTATIISFSLTFALAGFALLMGVLPQDASLLASSNGASVETGVVLLVVPLVALVAAILFEATRLALRGPLKIAEPKPAITLSDWKPGHGEG
jgi:hypothetical protein